MAEKRTEGRSKTKREETAFPAQQSAKYTLVRTAQMLSVPETTLYRIFEAAGIKGGADGYDFETAAVATVEHFKTKSEQVAKVGEEAASRKKVAEAEEAEISLEKKRGTIILADECRRIFESFRIQVREMIRVQDGMTSEQKNELCDKIAGMNPFDESAT